MTSIEVMNTVRMLLDDGIDWYAKTSHVVDVINEAQIRMLDIFITANEYRALRPLTYLVSAVDMRQPSLVINNIVGFDGTNVRHPYQINSVVVYPNYRQTEIRADDFGLYANYVAPEIFLNYETIYGPYFDNTNTFIQQIEPHNLYYTIHKTLTAPHSHITQIKYTNGLIEDSRALVSFIAYPLEFGENNTLELASEYHYQVCSMAAEILNSDDVMERERGKVAVPEFGQKLDIEKTGNLYEKKQ